MSRDSTSAPESSYETWRGSSPLEGGGAAGDNEGTKPNVRAAAPQEPNRVISEQRMEELANLLRDSNTAMEMMSDSHRAISLSSRRSILDAQMSLGAGEQRRLC